MPPKNFVDLSGAQFGKLTVTVRIGSNKAGSAIWDCLCDCGSSVKVATSSLKNGNTKSCGCLKMEKLISRSTTHGLSGGHGKNTRLYRVWLHMRCRCLSKTAQDFKYYGGRGIKICAAWAKYENFHAWAVGNGYAENLTLDRKDNNGDYEPCNCRWATRKQQSRNTRQNRIISFGGDKKTVGEWAEITGLGSTLRMRLHRGWSPERSITTPKRQKTI